MPGMFLAADVGGTKTLLALFERRRGKLREIRSASYASAEHPSFEAIVKRFLAEGREKPRRAAVGVAGPVVNGRSQVVNVRWPVDAKRFTRAIGGAPAFVLNDLEATAWGLRALSPSQVVNLTPALRPRPGNAALIAAGTGLGMAILFDDDGRRHPSASEGGHQDFAPRDEDECALLLWMRKRHPRVSLERIVAGPGFSAIYDFLVESGRGIRTPLMRSRLERADRNAAVSEAGVAGEDPTAELAVDMFVSLYGAAAGNLALIAKASGGVWVGGGIAPKILPKLREGTFLEAFRAKGRLTPFVSSIPVKVVLEPRTALLGAAVFAARGKGD